MQIIWSLQEDELEIKFLRGEDTERSRVTSAKCKFRASGVANLIRQVNGEVSDTYLAIFRFETQEHDLKKAADAFWALSPIFKIKFGRAELIASFLRKNPDQKYSETDILRRIKGIAKGRTHLRDHLKAKGLTDDEIDSRLKEYLKEQNQLIPSETHNQVNENDHESVMSKEPTGRARIETEFIPLPEQLVLISRRGTRLQSQFTCSECCILTKPVWRYSESNVGEVCLCSRCKPKVFNRSFDKIDAMQFSVQAGLFESNRQRH